MPKCCVLRRVLTFGDPMVYSPPDSSVHGISQARILEYLLFQSPGNLLDPGIEPKSLTLQTDFLWSEPPAKPIKVKWALRWNTGLVSSWSKTPENSLCVSVSFILSLYFVLWMNWKSLIISLLVQVTCYYTQYFNDYIFFTMRFIIDYSFLSPIGEIFIDNMYSDY